MFHLGSWPVTGLSSIFFYETQRPCLQLALADSDGLQKVQRTPKITNTYIIDSAINNTNFSLKGTLSTVFLS